jgi:transposase
MLPNHQQIESKNLDHLGLVAGMYDELGIGQVIDEAIKPDFEARHVSIGQTIKAMVLNGLGFINQRLYWFPKFFQDQPVERLIGKGIKAEHLNEPIMGRALDDIYEYDVTSLYSQVSIQAVQVLGLKSETGHLDSTSFHTDGIYKRPETLNEDSPSVIKISKGYRRDHRPDLNPAILQLLVENQAGIPVLMKPMDGNSEDKTGFQNTIETHINQLSQAPPLKYLLSDSALDTEKTLQTLAQNPTLHWITRVPETITEAKQAIETVELSKMTVLDEPTRYQVSHSNYAGLAQRWILIHSAAAEKRAKRLVDKQALKTSTAELKNFNRWCRKNFACQADAQTAWQEFEKTLLFSTLEDPTIKALPRYKSRGKPSKKTQSNTYVYQIQAAIASSVAVRETRLKRNSGFILATNELDREALPDSQVLVQYKNQPKVEKGFRFLKDPLFLADSLFLKSPKRIMALMGVMTICLLVYAALEYRIRQALKNQKQTFPNQTRKPIENPTIRWVFQYFVGIHFLILDAWKTLVSNLEQHHLKILSLLGKDYEAFYS